MIRYLPTMLTAVLVLLTGLAPLGGQEKTQKPESAKKPKDDPKKSDGEFSKPLSRMELKDGDSIVFLGDSITHQCLYTQYLENFLYTRLPNIRLKTHNAGVGGATAWDALQRFDDDVAAYKPKYVTVLLGMNDGRYRPFDKGVFDTYQKDMTELIGRIKKTGATPVLMTPTMYDSRARRMRKSRRKSPETTLQQYNAVLAYFGSWLREVATDRGYGFVDMYARLNSVTLSMRKRDPKFTVIPDAVHPGPEGQVVMAYSVVRDQLSSSILSGILIGRRGKQVVGIGRNGKISGLKATKDRFEFTFQAKYLPWVVPEEAQKAMRFLNVPNTINQEILRVLVLPAGDWELSIDGEVIGTYKNTAYFNGLKLHNSKKTPQYKQALQIATLNKQRNEGPVRSLRNEWRTFQQYARVKRQLESSPDDAKLKKQFDALKAKIKGLGERVKKHEQAARKIEDKIFEINKPKARKYVIRKVVLAGADDGIVRTRRSSKLPLAAIAE